MIAPYTEPQPLKRVAWLLDKDFVLDDQGTPRPLTAAIANGWSIWSDADRLRGFVRQGEGSCVLWRYTALGWSPDPEATSFPVRGLTLPQLPLNPDDAIAGIVKWRDWLHKHGAAPQGSLGGSGLSLLKATLRRPLWTSVGDVPPITWTLGGRQQDAGPRPAVYEGRLHHYDIQAAYASQLGAVRYGGRWVEVEPRQGWWRDACTFDQPVFVRARVRLVSGTPWYLGPLPRRPRRRPRGAEELLAGLERDLYPHAGTVQGCWTLPEVEQAEAAGARIKVLGVWVHVCSQQPFRPWYEAVWEGRELGGFAGLLAKATGNATWGQFAISRDAQRIIEPGSRPVPFKGGNPSTRAYDLGEWITGSVRAQLYQGMRAAGDGLVSAHTDGLWCSASGILGWRRTRTATHLRILNPQCYAYRDGDDPWRYTVAGVLDPPAHFEQTWARLEREARPTGHGRRGRVEIATL